MIQSLHEKWHAMLIDQFRTFYFQNIPNDMETQIEYFAVFGGVSWVIDTSVDLLELIRVHILEHYETLQFKIDQLTMFDTNNQRLLAALAVGDRRMFSAFNRAGLNNKNGGIALNFLQEKGLIGLEYSREEKPHRPAYQKQSKEEARQRISHKVLFSYPFLRFWFYFVYPHRKEISEKNYEGIIKRFEQRRHSYTSLIFEELSEILLNYHIRDTQIESSGSYWDAKIEIDILTTTENGMLYVGECKWSNHKVSKNELNKLHEKCQKLNIQPDQILFFAKRGFSKELKQLEGKSLALYTADDFEILLKKSSQDPNKEQCLFD